MPKKAEKKPPSSEIVSPIGPDDVPVTQKMLYLVRDETHSLIRASAGELRTEFRQAMEREQKKSRDNQKNLKDHLEKIVIISAESVKSELQERISRSAESVKSELRKDMSEMKVELQEKIIRSAESVKSELRKDMSEMKAELQESISTVAIQVSHLTTQVSHLTTQVDEIKATVSYMAIMNEEQNSRNRLMLEGLATMIQRQDRVEARTDEMEEQLRRFVRLKNQ